MSTQKRKCVSLNIDQKLEILNLLQSKSKTRKELAVDYGCDLSTIVRIVQQEGKIRNIALENGNTAMKRMRKGKYDKVDEAVTIWFRQMRAKNAAINGPMIIEEAKKFAQMLDFHDFKPSNGWLCRWKTKENVSFHKVQDEKGAADQACGAEWITNVLPALLADYDPKDVYNADEAGLFYKALPNGTFAARGQKPEVGKTQKDRLTALFLCNMDGSDKHVFVIGRSKQPHCFRGKKLPVPYYANAKAWMTEASWTKILLDFDSRMMMQERNVLLFVDNAACHKLEDGVVLKNVKIRFFPANMTSLIQPLDQGIIRSFKVYYRQQIVLKQLFALENGLSLQEFGKTINVFEALKMVERSWNLVRPTTIRNCFRKVGFSKEEGEEEPEIEEAGMQLHIPEDVFNDLVECDANLECYGELTAEEILEKILVRRNVDDVEEEEAQERVLLLPLPGPKDALAALTVLRAYFANNNADLNNVDALEEQFCVLSAATTF